MARSSRTVTADLRRRLELARAKELYVLDAPSRAGASERETLERVQRELGGYIADSDGQLYAEYVTAYEAYVAALREATRHQRAAMIALIHNYRGADQPFTLLVDHGADPVFMVRDCLYLEHRAHSKSRPALNRDAVRRRNIRARLKLRSRQFSTLADDCEEDRRLATEIDIRLRDNPVPLLRAQSEQLKAIVMTRARRGPSSASEQVLQLMLHVRLTTGHYHDAQVSALLDAVQERAEKTWSVESLDQLRRRDRRRSQPTLLETVIADGVDVDLQRLRRPR